MKSVAGELEGKRIDQIESQCLESNTLKSKFSISMHLWVGG